MACVISELEARAGCAIPCVHVGSSRSALAFLYTVYPIKDSLGEEANRYRQFPFRLVAGIPALNGGRWFFDSRIQTAEDTICVNNLVADILDRENNGFLGFLGAVAFFARFGRTPATA